MNCSLALLQLIFNFSADSIGHLAHNRALFRTQLTHHLQNGGQLALLTQQLDTEFFQCSRGFSSLQGCQSIDFNLLQLCFHFRFSSYKVSYMVFCGKKATKKPLIP